MFKYFSSDQPFYARQKDDGKYEKKYGFLTESLIAKSLSNNGSIAVYQKQQDFTVKWLCFDFDIIKKHLDSDFRLKAEIELTKTVQNFSNYLTDNDIPHTLEFSGNRGYHVWIFFEEKLLYSTASIILEKLVETSKISYDKSLVSLDKFPKTPKPSSGVGLGVKLPLSLHQKSGAYSYLIDNKALVLTNEKISVLSEPLLKSNLSILNDVNFAYISEIEKKLGCFFPRSEEFLESTILIKSIKTSKKIDHIDVIEHWGKSSLTSSLSMKIKERQNLNNNERRLVVGMLHRLGEVGNSIIHSIFSTFDNYNQSITEEAITSLKGYYFPSQSVIEHYLDTRLSTRLEVEDIIDICIPRFESYISANFEFSIQDIDIVKKSELNYLYSNDEVKSRLISDDLINRTNLSLLTDCKKIIENNKSIEFYRHTRQEENKSRELITLDCSSRVATSLLTKQISQFLDIDFGHFSHGYHINRGYKNLHIFKPWLNQWYGFISNISNAIEEPLLTDNYLVKTDINSFYDSIPHSRLQRVLLGETNSSFSLKIKNLKDEELVKYRKIVESLINTTKQINRDNIGLPQGPAYARYFAEVYLYEIDTIFKKLYYEGEILLYQRYVDDIFFICNSKPEAEKYLNLLKTTLSTLGLNLNFDKTVIKEIKNSKNEFDEYKSQSKYTVESVNREITIANENQKEMAFEEFINLIESDSAQHDLSFIFSHLKEVHELDEMKMDMIPDVLESGIGRGSMYRNMFNFIIQSSEHFDSLMDGQKFNELQSEVITSAMLDAYESDHTKWNYFHSKMALIERNLTISQLVEENICYISLHYGYMPISIIPENTFFKVLSKSHSNKVIADTELFTSFELKLNEISDLGYLISILYAIGFSKETNLQLVKFSMDTLIAKLSIEKIANNLDIYNDENLIKDELLLSKLYSFLCLITISYPDSKLSNLDITKYWEFCIRSFDEISSRHNLNTIEWANYLDLISVDYPRLNYVISHISEGGLIRGVEDKRKLFSNYNSVLLVHFILEDTKNTSSYIELTEDIKTKLISSSIFYKWLLDKEGTQIFPTNKDWFDNNALKNGVITLKNGSEILIRKRFEDFHCKENVTSDKFGYSDLIVDYKIPELASLRNIIKTKEPKDRISFLSKIINSHVNLPGIFTKESVLFKGGSKVFSDEFSYTDQIILEEAHGSISSLSNSLDNYVNSFFSTLSEIKGIESRIYNRYLLKLDNNINSFTFYEELSTLHIPSNIENHEIGVDLICSTAIYNSIKNMNALDKINRFLQQYIKIHDENYFDMGIFAIDNSTNLSDNSLKEFISTLIQSPKLINEKVYSGLGFDLDKDLVKIKEDIENILSKSHVHANGHSIYDFELARTHQYKRVEKSININGNDIHQDDFQIIDLATMDLVNPTFKNTTALRGADRVYFYQSVEGCIIFPVPSAFNRLWKIISERHKLFITTQGRQASYDIINSTDDIKNLPNFTNAAYVIEQHNQISNDEAESRLCRWLLSVPETERELVLKLVAAHEYMTKVDMDNFINHVLQLIEEKQTVLMIKNPEDYNGTHRIFYQDIDSKLSRSLKFFSPLLCSNRGKNNTTVTFVVDNILSGSQFISSMKYYAGEIEKYPADSNLYRIENSKKDEVNKFIKSIQKIQISTVIYNTGAVTRIQKELQSFLPHLTSVEVIHGNDIRGNAFFGTTSKLSANDKAKISDFLLNTDRRRALYESLGIEFDTDQHQYSSQQKLDKINMISRYSSMPKGCFLFLIAPSMFDRTLKILNRVEERKSKKFIK